MGGERISQEIIYAPVENNTQEVEVDGISNDEFLQFIGVDPEKRTNTLNQLESNFGDRVFHYGQYSGTVAEMMKCPVFYDKLQEGFDAAVGWLLEYDEPQEETDEADLVAEDPENKHELIDTDVDSRQAQEHSEKGEVVKLHSLSPEKDFEKTVDKSTRKDIAVKKSIETKPDFRRSAIDKVIPIEYTERIAPNVERVNPVLKEVLEKTVVAEASELSVEQVEQKPDTAIEAIQPVEAETIETPEITIENVEPVQSEVIEKQERSSSIEPQEGLSTFSIPQTSLVELPIDLPVINEDEAEPFVAIQETEVSSSAMSLEQMLPMEEEPIFDLTSEVQEQTEQYDEPIESVSIIETVIALTDKVPELVADIEPEKVYYQAEAITQKIKVFETLTTAEECKDALDALRAELELLLAHLGYKNAEEIAMNLLRQHDFKTLVEYMTVLKRSVTQSYGFASAPRRILKALMPYHWYGTLAVRSTVTSYA